MQNHLKIENILFLDIETVPEKETFEELSKEKQELFDKKTSYQRKDDTSVEEFYQQAGIWAEFGKIICISVGFITYKMEKRTFRVTSFYGKEKKLLLRFKELLEGFFSSPKYFMCGHNAKEFDFPYIARRMIIHGIALPEKLNLFGKKPWEVPHLDTLQLWKFGDYKHYTSLKLLTSVLNIPSPKDDIDGSMVASVYYKEKDINRIVRYCEKDTLAVAQVFLRLTGNNLLTENEILFVKQP